MTPVILVGIMFLVWLYVTDVVLDGNSRGKALILLKIKKDAGNQFIRCVPAGTPCRDRVQVRRAAVQEVRPPSAHISRQRKAHMGFLMFYSWYLTDGIGLLWCRLVVLFHDFRRSLPI